MARGKRDPKREAFWRGVLRRQRDSGLSVRAFCRREGLAETALHGWRRIIKQRDRERDQERQPVAAAFVPVVLAPDQPSQADGRIAIELRGGRVMRLPASMPPDRLAAVVHAIEAIEAIEGKPSATEGAA